MKRRQARRITAVESPFLALAPAVEAFQDRVSTHRHLQTWITRELDELGLRIDARDLHAVNTLVEYLKTRTRLPEIDGGDGSAGALLPAALRTDKNVPRLADVVSRRAQQGGTTGNEFYFLLSMMAGVQEDNFLPEDANLWWQEGEMPILVSLCRYTLRLQVSGDLALVRWWRHSISVDEAKAQEIQRWGSAASIAQTFDLPSVLPYREIRGGFRRVDEEEDGRGLGLYTLSCPGMPVGRDPTICAGGVQLLIILLERYFRRETEVDSCRDGIEPGGVVNWFTLGARRGWPNDGEADGAEYCSLSQGGYYSSLKESLGILSPRERFLQRPDLVWLVLLTVKEMLVAIPPVALAGELRVVDHPEFACRWKAFGSSIEDPDALQKVFAEKANILVRVIHDLVANMVADIPLLQSLSGDVVGTLNMVREMRSRDHGPADRIVQIIEAAQRENPYYFYAMVHKPPRTGGLLGPWIPEDDLWQEEADDLLPPLAFRHFG